MLSTLILWSKLSTLLVVNIPTLYNFLAFTPEEISHWDYYLTYPNKFVILNIFQPTLLSAPLYLHHMHDSGESLDVSVCHTVNTTSLPVCQLHELSVCQPECDSIVSSICQAIS